MSPDNFPVCLNINGFKIDRHNVTQLLGVSIDDKLRFDKHINDICVKASRQINALIRVKRYLDVKDRTQIYESFIIANFNFCPLVCHVCGTVSAKKIERIQKRALRFVLNDFTSDYDVLFIQSKYKYTVLE